MGGSFGFQRGHRGRGPGHSIMAQPGMQRGGCTLRRTSATWSHAITAPEPPSVARGFLFADLRNYSAWVESTETMPRRLCCERTATSCGRQSPSSMAPRSRPRAIASTSSLASPSAALNCGLRILELGCREPGGRRGQRSRSGSVCTLARPWPWTMATSGRVVNVTARVCGQAAAGELLVTDAVRSLTRTYLDVTLPAAWSQAAQGHLRADQPLSRRAGERRRSGIAVAVRRRPLADRRRRASDPPRRRGVGIDRRRADSRDIGAPGSGSSDSAGPTARDSQSATIQRIGGRGRSIPHRRRDSAAPAASRAGPGAVPASRCGGQAGRVPDPHRPAGPSPGVGQGRDRMQPRRNHRADQLWLWNVDDVGHDNADSALAAHGELAGATPGTCRENGRRSRRGPSAEPAEGSLLRIDHR